MILTITGSGRRLSWLSSVINIHWPLVSPYGGVSLVQEITCFMTALVKYLGIHLKAFSLEVPKISIITICWETAPAVSMQLSNLLLGNTSWGSLHHYISWWRHQMETFSALLAICAGNHRSPANSPHKGQWRGALMFSLICARINGWVNNGETGDLRSHRAHYDVIVMIKLLDRRNPHQICL